MQSTTQMRSTDGHRMGICADPMGNCPHANQSVPLYSGMCRSCYDRTRNSNTANKQLLPDLTQPVYKGDTQLKKSLNLLLESMFLSGATPEQRALVLKILGPLYRPIRQELDSIRSQQAEVLQYIPDQQDSTLQQSQQGQQSNKPTDPPAEITN
jgi:hypothetical protein